MREGSHLIAENSELGFLYDTVLRCAGSSVGRDAVWQVAPVFASIDHSSRGIPGLEAFEAKVLERIQLLGMHARRRAAKAFVSLSDSITKPSYINRLQGTSFGMAVSQQEILENLFVKEPASGGLVFSIFHPRDLLDRNRPGYVPCLVSGSLLLHRQALHLNAFFRSQSILEFGVHDLLFLRRLQSHFLEVFDTCPRALFPKRRSRPRILYNGPINLHFARIIIQNRLARSRSAYLYRAEVFDAWMETLIETIEEQYAEAGVSGEDHQPAAISLRHPLSSRPVSLVRL